MKKYIAISLHEKLWKDFSEVNSINPSYWVPDIFIKMVLWLEVIYPNYKYHSFNPAGSGGHQPFVIMKLKK